jgi:Ca-activated chloride channel family protein
VIEQFHFLRPLWLWLLLPLVWLVWRYWRRQQQGGTWQSVCDAHLLPHLLIGSGTRAVRTPIVLLALAGLFTIIALAGPVWSKLPQPVYHKSDATVVLLSLSDSMNSPDLAPTRLERAKLKLLDFLQRQREGQTALIAYAGEAYVVSPLTDDAATIESLVTSLQTNIMPVAGDHLSEALHKADALLDQDGVYKGGRVLLITDDAGDRAALAQATALARKGRVLSVLAVATPQGAPIPASGGGFVTDSHGAILIPMLNRPALAKLAEAGHGHLVMLTTSDDDLNQLWPLSAVANFKPEHKSQTHEADVWREQGPWLLLLVLPLLALLWRQGWLAIIVLAVVIPPPPAQASTWDNLWRRPDQQAYQALQHGDAKTAAKLFKDPQWRSVAQYRAGDFAAAAKAFGQAHNPDALYNQGNALARAGQLQAAAQNYRKVLQQQPTNEDAKHNLKLVEDLLKRQQQKQKPNQQNKQGQSGQQQSQNSKSGQSGQQQSQNSKSGQPGQQQSQNSKSGQPGQQQSQNSKSGQPGQQPSKSKQGQSAQQQAQNTAAGKSGQQQTKPQTQTAQTGKAQQGQNQSQPAQQQTANAGAQQDKAASAKPTPRAGQQAQAQQQAPAQNLAQQQTGNNAKDSARDQTGGSAVRETSEKSESAQALEQWLRRIPDDPGGLLRRKFALQHELRQQAENNSGN